MWGGATTQHKLWQIGKVYGRDTPVMAKGRMREFTQADFDISGVRDPMTPDAELLSLLCNILSKLDVDKSTIKLNHPKMLDGTFEKEMTAEKGLDPGVADKIGKYVKHKGGPDLLAQLENDVSLTPNKSAKQGLTDMGILSTLLNAYDVLDKTPFDLSLARGLDCYTGIIYEASRS